MIYSQTFKFSPDDIEYYKHPVNDEPVEIKEENEDADEIKPSLIDEAISDFVGSLAENEFIFAGLNFYNVEDALIAVILYRDPTDQEKQLMAQLRSNIVTPDFGKVKI